MEVHDDRFIKNLFTNHTQAKNDPCSSLNMIFSLIQFSSDQKKQGICS